jgi:hypothetical protein
VEAQVLAAKGGRIDGIDVEQVVRAVDRLRVIQ